MTSEQIDAVARRVVEQLAERRAREAQARAAVWGLLAQLDSAAIELRAADAHVRHVKQLLD